MKETILVQPNSNGRIKYVKLWLEGDTVSREWGLVGGKFQTTANTYGFTNKGKANELTPELTALADYERIIETKLKEGLLLTDSLESLPLFDNNQMDFENLPVQFCCSKPHTSITKAKFNKLVKQGKLRSFIKYNGLCHFILITSNKDVKIYTRRIDDHTRKYPDLVKSIKEHNFTKNTLLAVELVVDPDLGIPHMEGFKLISSISRSDTLKGKVKKSVKTTLKLQEKHRVKAVVFNVLFADEEDTTKLPYKMILANILNNLSGDLMAPKEEFLSTYDEACSWAKKNLSTIEGLVVWDQEENAEMTYNGKPNRKACYKLKASRDDDVVAYGYEEGSGAKQGKVGSLLIGKYDLEGKLVPFGKVGTGLKIKEGECEIDYWKFPCVIEIEYDQRFPTGSYQFPRFTKKHEDKIPSDIIIDENGM